MKKRNIKPESLMMSYGYKPELSEGALKCPIFQTSIFVFKKAEDGKRFFQNAYQLTEEGQQEEEGLIYSRLNNPDLEILEERLKLWDDAESCAVFNSGMAAISTSIMAFVRPGDMILYSSPVYGGTNYLMNHILDKYDILALPFYASSSKEDILRCIEKSGRKDRLKIIYIESPANPTNQVIDISMCCELAKQFSKDDNSVLVTVDNTYMGPIWQHPLELGADLVLYSCTKYIGGHGDVIAGACLGNETLIQQIKGMRTFLGNMPGPWTSWLLMRSMETLKIRMETQAKNAQYVAEFLNQHHKVEKVYYLGFYIQQDDKIKLLVEKQCKGYGAMISFDIKGGEKEAYAFLDNLKLIKLAVSLGGTESLAEHPFSMTHIEMSDEEKACNNITDKMVRLSIGIEYYQDIIDDIKQALDKV